MDLILEHSGRCYFRQVIRCSAEFEEPFGGRPYPCLVWTHEEVVADDERWALAERIVASQCRYAVCGGRECEAVHDAVDSAYIRPFLDPATADLERPMVMTTWHEGESFDEVASFFVLSTNFAKHDFAEYLVLHVGGTPPEHAALDAAVGRAAVGEAAV